MYAMDIDGGRVDDRMKMAYRAADRHVMAINAGIFIDKSTAEGVTTDGIELIEYFYKAQSPFEKI